MQAALVDIQHAISLELQGNIASAIVSYEAGTKALVKAVCAEKGLDEASRRYVWEKIGEYTVRCEELKAKLGSTQPQGGGGGGGGDSTTVDQRLASLRVFHKELQSGAVKGGYGSEQLRSRLEGLRGRPSVIHQPQDTKWVMQDQEPKPEEEQVSDILLQALEEARLEGGPESPSEVAFNDIKASLSAPFPQADPREVAAATADAARVRQEAIAALKDQGVRVDQGNKGDDEDSSEEYSDEKMEQMRKQEKARRKLVEAKAKKRFEKK